MQVVAGIVRRQQLIGMGGIAHDLVEIDHRIEMAWCPDPRVDRLAVGLVDRRRMITGIAHVGRGGGVKARNGHCSENKGLPRMWHLASLACPNFIQQRYLLSLCSLKYFCHGHGYFTILILCCGLEYYESTSSTG